MIHHEILNIVINIGGWQPTRRGGSEGLNRCSLIKVQSSLIKTASLHQIRSTVNGTVSMAWG